MTFADSVLPDERNTPPAERPTKASLWTGWVLSTLAALFLLSGGVNAWFASPQVIAGTAKLGYTPAFLPVLGTIEILCVVLYLIPRTAVLGAILLTAYFGGAVASHARIGDPLWVVPVLFGVVVWIGLAFRRPDLRKHLFSR